MKIKYTLQGSKRVIIIDETHVTLHRGSSELDISSQAFTKIKPDLDRYTSLGILQYEAPDDSLNNRNQDDQKSIKQNLLKQCKELGIPVANTMTVEILQGLIDKHLVIPTDPMEQEPNNSQTQDDTGNNPSNS